MTRNDQRGFEYPRVLEYRKWLKLLASVGRLFIALLFVGLIIQIFGRLSAGGQISPGGGAFLFFILVAAILYAEFFIVRKKFEPGKIQVYQDRILMKKSQKEDVALLFDDIHEITVAHRSTRWGRFTVILKNEQKFKFGIGIERCELILEAIVSYNRTLIDSRVATELRNSLILGDHSIARLDTFLKNQSRWLIVLFLFFVPFLYALSLYLMQIQFLVIRDVSDYFFKTISMLAILTWGLAAVFHSIVNLLVDQKLKRRLKDDPKNKLRDTKLENAIYEVVLPAFFVCLVILFVLIYQFSLNTLSYQSRTIVFQGNPKTVSWLDRRFNCFLSSYSSPDSGQCHYALKRGDLVEFKSRVQEIDVYLIGTIQGLPGEDVGTGSIERDIQIVPPKKIAIELAGTAPDLVMVPEDRIIGRLFEDLNTYLFHL